MPRIGTAAWSIPKNFAARFANESERESSSHLIRYASQLNAVEINTSFYKDHQPKTYARWRDETPADFQFSVKLAKRFTHVAKLEKIPQKDLQQAFAGYLELKEKFGFLLIQLPPSLAFKASVLKKFVTQIRKLYVGPIAIEPRHKTWADEKALAVLDALKITKVEADPERCPSRRTKAKCRYLRLHGSPVIYKSEYTTDFLNKLADGLTRRSWVVFDNTTFGLATGNALDLSMKFRKKDRSL